MKKRPKRLDLLKTEWNTLLTSQKANRDRQSNKSRDSESFDSERDIFKYKAKWLLELVVKKPSKVVFKPKKDLKPSQKQWKRRIKALKEIANLPPITADSEISGVALNGKNSRTPKEKNKK